MIALAAGGALDTVVDGVNGVLFQPQTADAVIAAVRRFESIEFSGAQIAERAARFSRSRFEREISEFVERFVVERQSPVDDRLVGTATSWN